MGTELAEFAGISTQSVRRHIEEPVGLGVAAETAGRKRCHHGLGSPSASGSSNRTGGSTQSVRRRRTESHAIQETSGRLTTVPGRRADIGRVLPRVKIGRARPVALNVGRGAIGRLRGSGGRVLLIGGRDGLEFVEQS